MSEQNDKDLEEKKSLLQAEILDKNYDQIKFVEFCLSKKPNGDDLTIWSLDELKSTIQEFITKFPNTNINTNLNINNYYYQRDNPQNDFSKQINDLQKNIENINVQTPESNKANQNQTIKLKCKILEKSELNDKKIVVTIKNPKPVVTNFLSSNYVEYEVETKEMNWLVKRRYSDFEWLRQVLTRFNPGHMIPPYRAKKLVQGDLNLTLLQKE